MHSLTIFTPTYNRAEHLKVCYQSLIKQSNQSFVWQVVDDGSDDGTRELIEDWIRQQKIAIEYHWKPNGGKASAINVSLEYIATPFWVCLDSDDYLMDEQAVDMMLEACEGILEDPHVCGAFTVRSDATGKPMKGIGCPCKPMYATQLEIRYKYKIPPEYVQIYKSDIIRQFRFPIYEGERFVTESWLQDQLDQRYVFKLFDRAVMVCKYLPDGLTNQYYRLIQRNPRGFLEFYGQRTELCRFLRPRLTAAILYNAVYELLDDRSYPKKKHWMIRWTAPLGKLAKRRLMNGG